MTNSDFISIKVGAAGALSDDGGIGVRARFESDAERTIDVLRESERRFRMLADNMSQLAWTCDLLGNVTWYNKRWLDYTGLTFEDMKGWGWSKVHHPDHVARAVARVEHAGDIGEPWEDTFPLRGRDGHYRWFLSRAMPIRNEQGNIVQWFGTNTDITEQKLAEEKVARQAQELLELNERLKDLDRAKTRFLSDASHEFRTPLTLMLGPLEEVLRRPSMATEDRAQLAVAHRNGLRLLKLVNTLLDFSRVEAGRARAVYRATDLADTTADLASNFRSACAQAGLRLIVDCPALPEPVYIDRDMWEKIVLNLVSNAFKFTFEGEIAVTLRARDGLAELTVRDTGIGIPESELPCVFERFHRIENAAGRSREGTGIGLALVQELVKLHGGTIDVASIEREGTTFTVRVPFGTAHLPADGIGAPGTRAATATRAEVYLAEALRWLPNLAQASTLDSAADAEIPIGGETRSARVLFADDNVDMRDHVRRVLNARYEVEVAGDGKAALDAISARRPDLVLADVMMPRLDGFDLLKAIRAAPELRDIPVVLLSARAGEEAKIDGLEAGADDYLVKPFSARELATRVEATLRLARLRKQGETILGGQKRILEMVAAGAPLNETLDALMLFVEAQEPGARCGLLIVTDDDSRHFRHGSGPSLPERYHAALDGVPIAPPHLASCGEAAHRCAAVVVPDISNDIRFASKWRDLMLSCGLKAVRSTPVCGSDGRVLASLAIYYDHPRDPNPRDPGLVDMATHLAAIAIERARDEARMRKELAAAKSLQLVSSLLIHQDEPSALHSGLVDAAAALMNSEAASLQMLDDSGRLRLLAWKGFHPHAAAFWEWVTPESETSCGQALREGKRIMVANLATGDFIAGAEDLKFYRLSGIQAMQSTPLISRRGRLLGMISTHWRTPHQPAEDALRLLDVVARQAADLIERTLAEERLRDSEEQLRLAVQAADIGLWDVDPVNDKVFWPARVKTMFGISANVPVSMADFYAGLHPEDGERVSAAFAAAIDPDIRARYDVEYRTLGKEDRVMRWVAAKGRGIFDGRTCVRVIGTAIDITARKQAEQRQQLLTSELAHRGKNLLAVVQTIASRSLSGTSSLDDAREALLQRIQALARSQSLLLDEGFEGAPVSEIMRLEFAGFSDRVEAAGPDVILNSKAAQTFALVVHELATNATKYGALSKPEGRVAVRWSIEGTGGEASFRFQWRERGGPLVTKPGRLGFGRILIEKAVAQDLRARPAISFDPEGLAYEIEAPLSAIAAGSSAVRKHEQH